MSKINVVEEMLGRHSDAEVVEHLERIMAGVVKNYRIALEKNAPEILWGNLGDIEFVYSTLLAIRKRDQERLAQVKE